MPARDSTRVVEPYILPFTPDVKVSRGILCRPTHTGPATLPAAEPCRSAPVVVVATRRFGGHPRARQREAVARKMEGTAGRNPGRPRGLAGLNHTPGAGR